MAITDWPVDERPRERLLAKGADALSDAELLAIFLRTGIRGKSAVDLVRDLLTRSGSPSVVRDYSRMKLQALPHEVFVALFLDAQNRVIGSEELFRGTLTQTSVYPREVVKRALELGASSLILVHNHPSGDAAPSRADIAMTREIVAAAKALKIEVHDHLVIGRGTHSSFKALGLL
jgi:DNA repair protein RadC